MRAQSYIWCEFRASFLTPQAILCGALLCFFVLFIVFIVVSLHPPFMSPGKKLHAFARWRGGEVPGWGVAAWCQLARRPALTHDIAFR